MYIPIGDRLLVVVKTLTEELKSAEGIILPEGFTTDDQPPEALLVIAKGSGPACDQINVGDFVINQPGVKSYGVYTSKENHEKYHIIYAANILCRALRTTDKENLIHQRSIESESNA